MDKIIVNNLPPLLTYAVVVKQGSFTGAAKELSIQTSTIMRSIDKLEHCLKLKLLKRTSKGVSTTSDGERIYQAIQGLSEPLATLKSKIYGNKQKNHNISIALPHGSTTVFIDTILRKALSSKQIRFNISEYDASVFSRDLKDISRWASQFDIILFPDVVFSVFPRLCENHILLDTYPNELCFFTTTDFIENNPIESLDQLEDLPCVMVDNFDVNSILNEDPTWSFKHDVTGKVTNIMPKNYQSFSSVESAFHALNYAGGIALLPDAFLLNANLPSNIKAFKIKGHTPIVDDIKVLFNIEKSSKQKFQELKSFLTSLNGYPKKEIIELRNNDYGPFGICETIKEEMIIS